MTQSCLIRPVVLHDLPMVLAWRNHPSVRQHMFTQHEISLDEHCRWFERASRDSTRRLLIVEDEHEPLGYVQFTHVSEGGVSEWGFYLRPTAPKGTGRKLGVTALNYAFLNLALHKVCGQALEGNDSSIAFHKRLGFKQEGFFRDQKLVSGQYHSLCCFGLLAHEWQTPTLSVG